MKRQYIVIVLLVGILAVTAGMLLFFKKENAEEDYINRAFVAKMLALVKEDDAKLYEETKEDSWYAPYLRVAQADCGMLDDGSLGAMDLLTYGEAEGIAKHFGVDEDGFSFKFRRGLRDKSIPASRWYEIYDHIIPLFDRVKKETLLVLGSPSNMEELEAWQCMTDQGVYSAKGLPMDNFMDMPVIAYVCGNEIAAVPEASAALKKAESLDTAKVRNVWVREGSGQTLTVQIHGYERTFALDKPLAEQVSMVMADLVFSEGMLFEVTLKPTVIKGEILAVGDDVVEIKNYGQVPLAEDFLVYDMSEGEGGNAQLQEVSADVLSVGNKHTEFVVEGEAICAAIIRGSNEAKTIRAVLSCDGYTGYIHSAVTLTSDVDFWTIRGDERTDYAAGTLLVVDAALLSSGESMTVQTSATSGRVELVSLNRSQGHPSYRGSMEITNTGEGMVLVNEVLLEEYLYGVVPSEMPSSYAEEALKVQAVCARSFAVGALKNPRFSQYNAHVDDSTASQVYQNAGEDARATAAVDATAGEVLTWQDEPIATYFYSTSSGSSADPSEIWLSGGEDVPYIKGRLQVVGQEERDFSSEDAFRTFMDDYAHIDYFEKDVSWFRWKVDVNVADLRTALEQNLLSRIQAVPSLITVQDAHGDFIEQEISTIGDVRRVTVHERGTSGVLKSVIVEGSEAVIKIAGEYNIRLLLAPTSSEVICDDGTNMGTRNMLPSGFFYIDDHGDGTYTLRGGGFGHGAGMSQNGVEALAGRGQTYEQILTHYFADAKLTRS